MMSSSVHSDRGWLTIAFRLTVNDRVVQVRLYPGIRDTRDGRRSPEIKEIRDLIQYRQWPELAVRFPRCKALRPFRAPDKDRSTFRQVSERFLLHQGNINQPATVRFYEGILKAHIWPTDFADKALKLIGASDVAAISAPVYQAGHQAQAVNIRRTLSAVFLWARGERGDDGEYLVNDNPVSRTRRPVVDKKEDDIDPFTPDEIKLILSTAKAGWVRRFVMAAIGSGLEPGENFGLKIADLDFPARKIKVRQKFTRFGPGRLKNARRRREIDMSEPVYRALKEQVAAVELRSPWLWTRGIWREPYNPQNFTRRIWKNLLKRAGVKHRRFYQCRHTFATLLLRRGVDWQYVADQMGHVDLTMLTKVYWRWRPGTAPKPQFDVLSEALAE